MGRIQYRSDPCNHRRNRRSPRNVDRFHARTANFPHALCRNFYLVLEAASGFKTLNTRCSSANIPVAGAGIFEIPVPVRMDCCGLLDALSATFKAVARAPAAVGVKVTMIVQLSTPGKELPQVPPVNKKSAVFSVTKETLIPVTLKAFVFVSVNVTGELPIPTRAEPKF